MTPDLDAQSADSSPAPVAPSSADRLAQLNDAEMADWRSGKLSTRDLVTVKEPVAASPAALPEVPAASTDATLPPASEPGTPPTKPKTEARFQELLADRAKERDRGDRLEKELADLRRQIQTPRDVPPAAPSAASAPPTLAETVAKPDLSKPSLTEAEFFAAFPDAPYGEFGRYVARYEFQALRQAERQEQQQQQVVRDKAERWSAFEQRRIEANTADPGFLERLGLPLDSLIPVDNLPAGTQPTAWNDLAQGIVESPSAIAILRHLAAHPDDLNALVSLPSLAALARAFGKLEARVESSTAPAVPPAHTITSAPPPPPTLGTRPGEPGDVVRAALRDKDPGRYIAEMNKRDWAARGR